MEGGIDMSQTKERKGCRMSEKEDSQQARRTIESRQQSRRDHYESITDKTHKPDRQTASNNKKTDIIRNTIIQLPEFCPATTRQPAESSAPLNVQGFSSRKTDFQL
eukprot:scaffold725_cov162-Ochromonas_danica.AAC.11